MIKKTALVFSTWLWGDKYDLSYVAKLSASLRRNLSEAFRFLCMTERDRLGSASIDGVEFHAIKDPQLTKIKGCYARLRMFDPGWQRNRGIVDRLVNLDLDVVVTGGLDGLFDRPDRFAILQGVNSANPCPYNGTVMMLRPGAHENVWTTFSVEAAAKVPFYQFPDDQGWLWHKAPGAGAFTPKNDGIYAFEKPGWPQGLNLPKNARIVGFPGHRDPSQYIKLNWVADNWTTARDLGEEESAA